MVKPLQHHRVVEHVDDLGLGRDLAGDVVDVDPARHRRAEHQELVHARLGGQVQHAALEERLGHLADDPEGILAVGQAGIEPRRRTPIDLEVGVAALGEGRDARRRRYLEIDLDLGRPLLVPSRHGHRPSHPPTIGGALPPYDPRHPLTDHPAFTPPSSP
jgi:hypothetical protein